MKLKLLIACSLSVALSGCVTEDSTTLVENQCLRVELFDKCMANLPVGPKSTVYNDWDEVVESCENAAYYQALRPAKFVPEQCGGTMKNAPIEESTVGDEERKAQA